LTADSSARRQVLAILDSNGLRWSAHGDEYALRFSSALLLVGFAQMGALTVVTLRAPVLRDVPLEGQRDFVLARLNDLNCASHFGKWALYEEEGVVALEYDLLGDYLQENELMAALTTLARFADQQDDILQRRLGGERSFEQR
jgi:hypothetical protein